MWNFRIGKIVKRSILAKSGIFRKLGYQENYQFFSYFYKFKKVTLISFTNGSISFIGKRKSGITLCDTSVYSYR